MSGELKSDVQGSERDLVDGVGECGFTYSAIGRLLWGGVLITIIV